MRSLSSWGVLLAFLAIAAFFLLTEHRAHVWGVAPYLLLLACPLLHFFMHGRHGGHGGHGRNGSHAGHQQGRSGEAGSPAGPGARKA
jgi:Protein of unknown function (DUF2933)